MLTVLHELDFSHLVLLVSCVAIALGFEFVNGFHDTANAVATVIYTNTLKPRYAVVLSGLCNFMGVFLGGIAVAMGIIKLLPVELLVQRGAGVGLAMVLALLFSAILWNVATWYLGLPASSSHTLIGAILGVGLANSAMAGHLGAGVNWGKAAEIGLSLLVSPVIGFCFAGALVLVLKRYLKNPAFFQPPPKDAPPPPLTRGLLVLTCSGVSFAHGSNDGQKGVGLVMLVLMGLAPAAFAVNLHANPGEIEGTRIAAARISELVRAHASDAAKPLADTAVDKLATVEKTFAGVTRLDQIPANDRFEARTRLLLADGAIDALLKAGVDLSSAQKDQLKADRKLLRATTDYAPDWVLFAIALALGLGTMIGWKRIVVTIGEKIGKSHLTYAQGASAELVAMSTIGIAAWLGLPVSTTHVLSSGVAGTMVSQGTGVDRTMVTRIALAWVLTLPMSMLLSAGLLVAFKALLT